MPGFYSVVHDVSDTVYNAFYIWTENSPLARLGSLQLSLPAIGAIAWWLAMRDGSSSMKNTLLLSLGVWGLAYPFVLLGTTERLSFLAHYKDHQHSASGVRA